MNKDELVPHIRKTWLYAKALKIDELFSLPTALEASEEFKALAMNSGASYEELYLVGLQQGQYNILLKDFSFFQFGIGATDGVRFAFYPNPFLGAAPDAVAELQEMREFVTEGIIDIDEFLHRVSEIRRPQHPPLVRYEYSKLQYVDATHPCSHIHMGFHGDNRWPVRRLLSAEAFALLVFRIFYLHFWLAADPIKSGEQNLTLDQILNSVRLESRMLYSEEFSEMESQRFYLI